MLVPSTARRILVKSWLHRRNTCGGRPSRGKSRLARHMARSGLPPPPMSPENGPPGDGGILVSVDIFPPTSLSPATVTSGTYDQPHRRYLAEHRGRPS